MYFGKPKINTVRLVRIIIIAVSIIQVIKKLSKNKKIIILMCYHDNLIENNLYFCWSIKVNNF